MGGATFQLGTGVEVSILVSGEESARASMIVGALAPGLTGPPPHLHRGFDELYLVLEGELELRIGDRLARLGPGDSAHVPAGTVHTFRSIGAEAARFMNVYAPGGFECYFADAAAVIPPHGPPDPDAMARIASRYDLVLASDEEARQ